MLNFDKKLLQKALDLYKEDAQVEKLIEEMSELTKALLKSRHGGCKRHRTVDVVDETADVLICMETLKLVLQGDLMTVGGVDALLQERINYKQCRLADRMQERLIYGR